LPNYEEALEKKKTNCLTPFGLWEQNKRKPIIKSGGAEPGKRWKNARNWRGVLIHPQANCQESVKKRQLDGGITEYITGTRKWGGDVFREGVEKKV